LRISCGNCGSLQSDLDKSTRYALYSGPIDAWDGVGWRNCGFCLETATVLPVSETLTNSTVWSRKRLDIGWSDLMFGAGRVFFPLDRATAARRIESLWPAAGNTLACLSVRSGFDLLLGALDLPRGSEVLVSAITIPDMIRIIEHHGLVPVPVDLDPQRMTPTEEQWRKAVTPTARLILVAHLFGGRTEMGPVVELARRHKLLVVEDCAQAYAGLQYEGDPRADASMFSFGTIKNSTALGGAVVRVRDADLLARMRAAQESYPLQPRLPYLKRLAKYAMLKGLAARPICASFVFLCRTIGCDYDRMVNAAARGFPGDDFFAQIRRQPSSPLLAMLERRLRRYDAGRSERHVAKGKALAASLQKTFSCPGAAVAPHTYWVFPILVERPAELLEHLTLAGFDATQGQSLCVVAPPADRAGQNAAAAANLLAKVVFLPFYPEMPPQQSRRMATVVLAYRPGKPSNGKPSSGNGQIS
jgi:perosamine synthetase